MKFASKLLVAALAAAWPACRTAAGGDPAFTNETCSDACARLAAADCGDVGSSCVSSCLAHPNASYAASCGVELASYLDCFWLAESFECAADERTIPVGCSTQLVAYEACRSGPDSGGAGGVGGAPGAAGSAEVEP
jgi:hypothetical protein